MAKWTPNARYRHVFVVIRVDPVANGQPQACESVSATKAFWTQEAAEDEVQRLERINAGKRGRYLWTVARLDRGPDDAEP